MRKEDFEISKMSYTSKDFASIYPEVLQIAETLTNKWTPTQSNESDPGVVLLKEAAFVADHNNYNIDKNILENFLPSATQDRSVRDICEMNGYTPRYYVSATGEVKLRYRNKDAETTGMVGVVIPRFTLVITNDDESISYTQVTDLTMDGDSNKDLTGTCMFMQGTLQTLSINNSGVITLSNLDDNNRLYLPEFMVAQNGIYIISADNSREEWVRDNYLLTKPSGSKVYKIDYDSYTGLPYIEFPSDIASLIGSGLYIRYISTLGEAGNVSAGDLVNIVSPTEYIDLSGGIWSMENFTCSNATSFMNGKDPETIDQMYNSFMHTVGTFDTLVTCLDYSNYIYNIEDEFGKNIVSNVHVTDRRVDYNKALNVVTNDLNGEYLDNISLKSDSIRFSGCGSSLPTTPVIGELFFLITAVQPSVTGTLYLYDVTGWKEASNININDFTYLSASMTPYDLSIYALKIFSLMDYNSYVPHQALENSFKPVSDTTLGEIKSYLEDSKNICHTYKDPNSSDIFIFKNYAPLRVSIITYSKVTKAERDEILNNIYIELSKNFNPRNIEFGDELNREELKKVIIKADSRIKDINLDFDYYMKAMTQEGLEYSLDNMSLFTDSTILVDMISKNILAGRVCLFDFDNRFKFDYGQSDGAIYEYIDGLKTEVPIKVSGSGNTQIIGTLTWTEAVKINAEASNNYYYKYNLNLVNKAEESITANQIEISSTNENKGTFIIQEIDSSTNKVTREWSYSTLSNIYYRITAKLNDTYQDLYNSHTSTMLRLPNCVLTIEKVNVQGTADQGDENVNYKLKANETVQIIYPNYYSTKTYGTYVLYRYSTNNIAAPAETIKANQEHQLTVPITIKYTDNGTTITETLNTGTTIRSDFDIVDTENASNTIMRDGEKYASLSSNQTISVRERMRTNLNNTNLMCYWIIKSSSTGENILFDPGKNEKILGDNDYFIYADEALNEIIILGAGTKLEKLPEDNRSWLLANNNYSIDSIANNGIDSEIPWKRLDFNKLNLYITEMTVISLSEGDSIQIWGWDLQNDFGTTSNIYINNTWKYCSACIKYTIGNDSSNEIILPKMLNYYMIRSRLDIGMSADYPQELYEGQVVTAITSGINNKIEYPENPGTNQRVFIQSNVPIVATGGDYVDLSLYKLNNIDLHLYTYSTGVNNIYPASASKVVSIPTDKNLSGYRYPFWVYNPNEEIYPNSNSAYIIPIYVENSELKVCVSVCSETGTQTVNNLVLLEDFNNDLKTIAEVYNSTTSVVKRQYVLTGGKKYFLVLKSIRKDIGSGTYVEGAINGEYYLRIWTREYTNGFKSASPSCVVIEPPILVRGLNKKLSNSVSTKFENNEILKRIKSIISGSDNPNIKPNYIYEPDSSMAIDLDRYILTDAITGENSSLAFDNPLILFDNNNVVHDMTIAQVDIANSNIDVSRDMRSY